MDKQAPEAPSILGVTPEKGTGGEHLSNTRALVLNGKSEALSKVELYLGTVLLGFTQSDAQGNWSVALSTQAQSSLIEGSQSFRAKSVDVAGNISADSPEFLVTLDLTKPNLPLFVGIDKDTGKANDLLGAQQRIPFKRLVTIALDPGHGGEDPGAIGARGSYEKNIVLSIAKRLKSKIDQEASMRPFLTREGDYFVPLHRRVSKARQVEADLFISIHADAFIEPRAKGASVFALSQQGATSSTARWMANKENSSDLIGGINIKVKDKQVAHLLLDMSTTAQINDSLKVGNSVLRNIGDFAPLHKNKVEQAGFAVLKAPDIPSILIETAFISNPQEEKRLNDEGYQERIAEAILAGIKDYFSKNPPVARRD